MIVSRMQCFWYFEGILGLSIWDPSLGNFK